MFQLNVLIVGTTSAETLLLVDTLQQARFLLRHQHLSLEQALNAVPAWSAFDLVIARYDQQGGEQLLSLLQPLLQRANPPVMFLIDPYDPLVVAHLLNAGGLRVLPVANLQQSLLINLTALNAAPRSTEQSPAAETTIEGFPAASLLFVNTGSSFLEKELTHLFHASPLGIAVIRQQDDICLDCSDYFAEFFHLSRAELVGRVLPVAIVPDMIKQMLTARAALPASNRQPIAPYEQHIITRDRTVRHFMVYPTVILLSGEPCTILLLQDNTEQEQDKAKIRQLNDALERLVIERTSELEAANRGLAAETARRKNLQGFSSQLVQIISETPDVVFTATADGKLDFLNKAGRQLLQLRDEESVTYLDLFTLYPPEERSRMREEVPPQLLRDGIWRGETRFQRPDGHMIPMSQVLLCKKDDAGNFLFFASIARDISNLKRVEQDLRSSREHYRILAEAAHDTIFLVSKDGLMEYANEYACRLLGIPPKMVSGLPVSQFFPADFAASCRHMIAEVQEINQPVYSEGPFTHQNEFFWVGTWLVPVRQEDGSFSSIMGISRDITEQKKTEEAFQQALQNERRESELRANFFSMTSHQFRTPLSTILLSVELLHKHREKLDAEKQRDQLNRIHEAALHLNSLLNEIQWIGKVEFGRYDCSPREFDLIPFVENLVHEISLNDRGAHPISLQVDSQQIPVYLDPDVLRRVLDNLLSNAVKYSPTGREIKTVICTEGADLLIEVSDQGIGIPATDLQDLFQPFQRGSNASGIPGTGMGLAIVERSVQVLNGTVSLQSEEGQGTSFLVRIPVRYERRVDKTPAATA